MKQNPISVDMVKDPTKVRPKFIGSFTKRQVVCYGLAAVIGIPFYLATMDKIIATMKALGVIEGDKGKYKIKKYSIKNQKVVMFMLYSLMCIDNAGYYTMLELSSSPLFFPFEFTPDKAEMMEDERFVFSNFGGDTTVGIKE